MTGAARGRVDVGSWARRVLGWDGLLPVFMGAIPALIGALAPGQRGLIEVAGVALPIAAFLLRLRAGGRQIASNHCGAALRGFQFAAFCIGLLPLLLFEAMMVLAEVMPAGAIIGTTDDLLVLGAFLLVYLGAMTIAMYPGRSPVDGEGEASSSTAGSALDPGVGPRF